MSISEERLSSMELVEFLNNHVHSKDPRWGYKISTGETVAEIAAISGKLPRKFWKINMSAFLEPSGSGNTAAHHYVKFNTAPIIWFGNLNCIWAIQNDIGDTVAHIAARHGNLPYMFSNVHPELCNVRNINGESVNSIIENKKEYVIDHKVDPVPDVIKKYNDGISSMIWRMLYDHNESLADLIEYENTFPYNFYKINPELFIKPNNVGITPAHRYVAHHRLPVDFPHWGVEDDEGNTIAHNAANAGTLPKEFIDKHITLFIKPNKHGITTAHLDVRHHILPINFQHWDMVDGLNNTVAHIAASYGNLPDGFNEHHHSIFIRPNNFGVTPAQFYVMKHTLPVSFMDWGLKDKDGVTIAYAAALHGNLPEDFYKHWPVLFTRSHSNSTTPAHNYVKYYTLPADSPYWWIEDDDNISVLDIAAMYGNEPQFYTPWNIINIVNMLPSKRGIILAYARIMRCMLPLDFPYWGCVGDSGNTLAHYAARYGTLPDNFADRYPKLWLLVNDAGESIEYLYKLDRGDYND